MSANSGSVFWQVKSKRTDRFSALNSSSDNTEISKNTLWQFGFYKKKKKHKRILIYKLTSPPVKRHPNMFNPVSSCFYLKQSKSI